MAASKNRSLASAGLLGTLVLLLAGLVAATPPAPGTGHYDGPGVIVTSAGGNGLAPTIVDNGAVVCRDTDGNGSPDHGQGGACIRFDELAGDSVYVKDFDPAIGPDVVFQVCVDLDGDGVCGGKQDPTGAGGCFDRIVFSHETNSGANHNPLWVDPASSQAMWNFCGQPGFPGYIVITCAGVHSHFDAPGTTHTHTVTEGLAIGVFTGGTPSGDFCGAPTAAKAYLVV